AAGPRQRVESRLGERAQLVLAIAVGEVSEHEEREPIGRLLVEGAQDARIVGISRPALEQRLGLLAALATEGGVPKVDHSPQVAAVVDVDLERVPEVVQRRAGEPQVTLLLDGSRLGVALRYDEPPQVRAMLAWNFLPRSLALVCAEVDIAAGLGRREKDSPAI